MNPLELKIITYPDPRLRRVAKPVERFDEPLAVIIHRMFDLMREEHGVGLAAPQIGLDIRLFIANHTGLPEDDRIFVNPRLFDLEGDEEGEEGCLSLPEIRTPVRRARSAKIVALDLHGNPIEQRAEGYVARIWQHEFDHLNGVLITDRMGDVAKMTHRKAMRDLELKYEREHPAATVHSKKSRDSAPASRSRR